MRKNVSILILVLCYTTGFSQEPEKPTYQVAIRDTDGNLRSNENVAVQIIILQDSVSGNVVYIENHYIRTDYNGVVDIQLGNGIADVGTFGSLDWAKRSYYIKVRVDGAEVVTSQVLNIPQIVYIDADELVLEPFNEEKFFRLIFGMGLNIMSFKITPSQYTVSTRVANVTPGLNINIGCNLRLSKRFDFKIIPGILFGQRTIKYYPTQPSYGAPQVIESNLLEVPIIISYGYRYNKIKPYAIGGVNYRYDLAGKKEFDDSRPVYLKLKRSDLYYELGAGLSFYFIRNKLSIEIKMSNGLRDILVHEPYPSYSQYVEAIEIMKSQIWQLTFILE